MSKRERNLRSDSGSETSLVKLFSEALDSVSRRYRRHNRKWADIEKPVLLKRIRDAKRGDPRDYEIAMLTKMVKESELRQELHFLVHTSQFAWVVDDFEDTKQNVNLLFNRLEDLGIIKKQIKATTQELKKREYIFSRIAELWSGADIRERDYKKLLIYQTR